MTTSGAPSWVDATTDDALGSSDVTDLVARLARREVSAGELRDAALERGRSVNGALNAVTSWFDQPVHAAGRDATAPLSGIPTFLKDSEDLAGHVTSHGSRAVHDAPAAESAPFARHLLSLGLDLLGKSTLPEFGMTASTESSRFGATRNPWDTSRTAGGSSGGSAALVAAGVVPMAHGSDGGGSIRIPASCCGLVGLKPTRGRLPDAAALARLPLHITVNGVLTRTVRDTALVLALSERAFPAPGLPPVGHVTRPGTRRLRIGMIVGTTRGLPLDDEAVDAVTGAAALCSSLGHHVEQTDPPVDDRFLVDFLRYWAFLAFTVHHRGGSMIGPGFDGRRIESFTRGLSNRLVRQAEHLAGSLSRLRRFAREHEPALAEFDVLLSPVTGHVAPPIGHLGPDVEFRDHLVRLIRFASPIPAVQNASGSPAISLPLGRTADGLPLGVQLAAPFGREETLLQLALELEEAAPWPAGPAAGRAQSGRREVRA